ncbi:MAG: hypothetical protein GWO24_33315, partial [Akkermansiaceae bacterium]|nr:hypothetical protein [Akkermansiaceae bacterium]
EKVSEAASTKSQDHPTVSGRSTPSRDESPVRLLQRLASLPAGTQVETLSEHIYDVPDDELGLVLESIADHENPALKEALLTALYEETGIRPPITRLPLLLEIARQPETEASLKATIMAELGSELQAEHGTSWADWALAIEEHLAQTEGLIRVE